MTDKFIELIAEALEVERTKIELQSNFRDLEEWDSLALLSVIAALDDLYGVVIDTAVFDTLMTFEDIYTYCEKHKR